MISATFAGLLPGGNPLSADEAAWVTTENETILADPEELEDGSDLGDLVLLLGVGLGIVLLVMLVVWAFSLFVRMVGTPD